MGDFALKLDPSERITYVGKKLGEEPCPTTLKITNPTSDRQACKVKCTSNEMFRIRPPVFALKPGEETVVKLTFNAGKTVPDSGKHYFAVYYIKATDENKAPRACWSDHKGDPNGTKRLYVDFKKEEGDEKKEEAEKKEEEKKEGEEKKEAEEKKEEERKEEKKEEKRDEKEEEKKEDKKEEKKEDEKKEEKKEDEKKEEKK
ncbi:MSP domain protein with Glu-rich domain [Brugia malayi]|uniref:Major sperm protein n=1 Tax=Brugia malayi TaxID=6279 RepID=A0A4E9FE35_BRUMA|nr:MSP domain protein with Glu-rich domain [Brugia malayi]VIO94499.1 MSP domain protein with Glu-rich domain [Brugia malayi]